MTHECMNGTRTQSVKPFTVSAVPITASTTETTNTGRDPEMIDTDAITMAIWSRTSA